MTGGLHRRTKVVSESESGGAQRNERAISHGRLVAADKRQEDVR